MTSGKSVAIVFGASRGIGRQISLSLSAAGYCVVLCSKTTGKSPFTGTEGSSVPDPNSAASTIDSVLAEVEASGGSGLALPCDVRADAQIDGVVRTVLTHYGRIDAVIYNSGAIWWSPVLTTPTKRYDLMHQINCRGLYVVAQAVLPHFRSRRRGRLVVVSPPIYSRFIRGKTAYAMTKYGATILTLGLAMDLVREEGYDARDEHGVAVSSLWPAVPIQSAATAGVRREGLRRADIFGDAVVEMLKCRVGQVNGKTFLDEDFLREECGYDDAKIAGYALVPGTKPRRIMPRLLPDLRVAEQDDEGDRRDSAKDRTGRSGAAAKL